MAVLPPQCGSDEPYTRQLLSKNRCTAHHITYKKSRYFSKRLIVVWANLFLDLCPFPSEFGNLLARGDSCKLVVSVRDGGVGATAPQEDGFFQESQGQDHVVDLKRTQRTGHH